MSQPTRRRFHSAPPREPETREPEPQRNFTPWRSPAARPGSYKNLPLFNRKPPEPYRSCLIPPGQSKPCSIAPFSSSLRRPTFYDNLPIIPVETKKSVAREKANRSRRGRSFLSGLRSGDACPSNGTYGTIGLMGPISPISPIRPISPMGWGMRHPTANCASRFAIECGTDRLPVDYKSWSDVATSRTGNFNTSELSLLRLLAESLSHSFGLYSNQVIVHWALLKVLPGTWVFLTSSRIQASSGRGSAFGRMR